MTQKLLSSDSAQQYYKFHNGLLYYKNRLFVPNFAKWRKKLLTEYQCTPMAGHSGVEPTVARLTASFYWPGLYTATKSFVNHCDTCQLNKNLTQKKLGLLQALPIPSQVWDELTMDFVTHLPNSYGHTVIWVICDRLTKFVHFIALPTKFTAEHLAQDFSVEICRIHGIPKSIILDRDPLFHSKFWTTLFKAQGTQLKYSTAYHPETDGQTEVVNRTLELYLRYFVSDHPCRWYKFLHLAKFWHNSAYHSAIQMAPFQALYGRPPPTIPNFILHQDPKPGRDLAAQQKVMILLKNNLLPTRKQMEIQANKKGQDHTFETGDLVLLRLQALPTEHHSPAHVLEALSTLLWTFQDCGTNRQGCLPARSPNGLKNSSGGTHLPSQTIFWF